MEGSAEDLGAPESWEVADLDESMNRLNLLLKDSKPPPRDHADDSPPPPPPLACYHHYYHCHVSRTTLLVASRLLSPSAMRLSMLLAAVFTSRFLAPESVAYLTSFQHTPTIFGDTLRFLVYPSQLVCRLPRGFGTLDEHDPRFHTARLARNRLP